MEKKQVKIWIKLEPKTLNITKNKNSKYIK